MIIICLRNMVSCRGNRDDIFHKGNNQNKPEFTIYWNSLV